MDLRENPLTTILPHLLINLNVFQLKVDLFNNSWICNYRRHTFKHLLRFPSASMRKKLITSCSKSAASSQKPLLYLSSFHLNYDNSVLFRTAVVPPRETSVLRCSVDNTLGMWNGAVPHAGLKSYCVQNAHTYLVWKVGFWRCCFKYNQATV